MFSDNMYIETPCTQMDFESELRQVSDGAYLAESTTILVEGLPLSTTKSDLYTYFSKFGEVKYCAMVPLGYNLKLPSLLEEQSPYFNQSGATKQALFQVVEKEVANLIVQSHTYMQDARIYCSLVPQINREVTYLFDEVMSRKIFVFGLKKSVGEEFLRRYFGAYGAIENVRIVRHRKDNRSKGFGFVIFKNAQTREYVLSSGPFKIHNKMVRCVPFDAHLDCINGEKRLAATLSSPKEMSTGLPTASPKSGSLTSSKQQLPKVFETTPEESQAAAPTDASQEYKFNRSRIISSAAVREYLRRNQIISPPASEQFYYGQPLGYFGARQ